METITLPKTKYEIIEKKASLYEKIFRFLPQRFFGVEFYSDEQIKKFLKEDKINKETKNRLDNLLKAL